MTYKEGIAALVAVAALTIGLSACGESGSNSADSRKEQTNSQEKTEKKTEAPKPADLTGTWKQVNESDKDHYQQATITLTLDPTIRLIGTPDRPSLAAVAWGPYVLAALSTSTDMQSLDINRKDPESAFERQGAKLVFRHRDSGLEFVPLWIIDENQPYHAYVEMASH